MGESRLEEGDQGLAAVDRIAVTPASEAPAFQEAARLRDLSPQQWKSGIAAWLGWLFDGLDMHLYVLVAAPFVAELLDVGQRDPQVGYYGSWIQAAFLFGWALGGGFFGRIGDRLGRSRALMLTIFTYALFTGLAFFAQTWWQLLVFRFLAALGIGGEWAVGASLLAETWPRRWRPWLAAVLQTGVNLGVMLAALATFLLAALSIFLDVDLSKRYVFLVGVLPAFLVLWIRRAVPEPDEWQGAKHRASHGEPGFRELFQGPVRRTTLLTLLVCALALTGHWAFLFWYLQQLRNLPELSTWTEPDKDQLVSIAVWLHVLTSIAGNFLAGGLAHWLGYRRAVASICVAYFLSLLATYGVPRDLDSLWCGIAVIGLCQGVFALFTMYLPPLFPTLLRTTGAGFCYNIGRIAAGLGTVFFGLFSQVGDYRLAIVYAGFLFLPAAGAACLLPEAPVGEPARPADRASHGRLRSCPCVASRCRSSLPMEVVAHLQGLVLMSPLSDSAGRIPQSSSGATSPSLLLRVQANQAGAWERLVDLYAPLVYHWCRRARLGPEDAADVFQEVFRAVALHVGGFRRDRAGDSFRGWLRTITRNKIHDHFRRLEQQPRAPGGTDAQQKLQALPDAVEPDGDPPEVNLIHQQLHRILDEIRGDFEERTWQAFWQVQMDGRDTDAVGAALDMTPAAVRKAKFRVLRRLRQELGDLL
jgi:RNA polymerase sigma factor (sigma-70 family)